MNAREHDVNATIQLLRHRFSRPPRNPINPDSEIPPDPHLTAAAVLIPLVVRSTSISVLLTRRSDNLKHHPGQISFPGGRVEAFDASPTAAALRETEEEVGLHPDQVELLGMLPEYGNITGFRVTPVVGLVHPPFELALDEFEVAESFEVPLHFLMDRANHQVLTLKRGDQWREVYAMPYGERFIWGTTAAILVSLFRLLDGAG